MSFLDRQLVPMITTLESRLNCKKYGVSPKGTTDATTDAGGHSRIRRFLWEDIKLGGNEIVTAEKLAQVTLKFCEAEEVHVMTNKESKCWVRKEKVPKDWVYEPVIEDKGFLSE